MYRVGLPGWKLAAKAGVPLTFRVAVHHDKESNSYWADSKDLDGLAVAGATLDEIHTEVLTVAAVLLDASLNGVHPRVSADLRINDRLPCFA